MVDKKYRVLCILFASFELSLFLSLSEASLQPMEIIENFGEYQNYWETNRFWNEELNYSWAAEDLQFNLGYYDSSSADVTASSAIASKNIASERKRRKNLSDMGYYDSSSADGTASSAIASKNIASERNRRKNLSDKGYYDSSSPDGAASGTIASKSIASERNRRKKLSDKLLALREAVPKISKLDKASTIKDAIEYIQDLQEQERTLQAELMELESERLKNNPGFDFEQELPVLLRSKKTKYDQTYDHRVASSCPVEVHQLSVTSMGEKTMFVSLTCKKTTNTIIRIFEVFESLKLKIITANVTTLSGMVKKTVLIEVDEEEKEPLKEKIERAVIVLCN